MRKYLTLVALCLMVRSSVAEVVYDLPINNEITGTAKAYGQTFTAPAGDNIFDRFTAHIRAQGTSSTDFNFKVAAWDSSQHAIVGPILYTSAQQTAPVSSVFTDFTFFPNLALSSGSHYIAFLDNSEFAFSSGLRMGGNFSDLYTGGAFAFPSFTTDQPWNESTNGQDLVFGARFVPEPSAMLPIAITVSFLFRRGRGRAKQGQR